MRKLDHNSGPSEVLQGSWFIRLGFIIQEPGLTGLVLSSCDPTWSLLKTTLFHMKVKKWIAAGLAYREAHCQIKTSDFPPWLSARATQTSLLPLLTMSRLVPIYHQSQGSQLSWSLQRWIVDPPMWEQLASLNKWRQKIASDKHDPSVHLYFFIYSSILVFPCIHSTFPIVGSTRIRRRDNSVLGIFFHIKGSTRLMELQ